MPRRRWLRAQNELNKIQRVERSRPRLRWIIMALTKIASQSDLPSEGQAKEFAAGGKIICVANVEGEYSAMDNVCLHRGGPLGQGVVEDGKIVCPWHGWQYDPKSGEAAHNSSARVAVYALKIDGEDVLVEI